MKLNKYSIPVFAAALLTASCTDIENLLPAGGGFTEAQYYAAVARDPDLSKAYFNGMFNMMGYPNFALGGSRPDDYGYVMMAFCNDLEGADVILPDNNYNWFSVCGELSSRTANYANPRIRYSTPYNQIKIANDIIRNQRDKTDALSVNQVGQCFAIRAFAYEQMAPSFQFLSKLDAPCVPLVTDETTDFNHNPRATVQEIYNQVFADLDSALVRLRGSKRSSVQFIDTAVVYGLRARAYLALGKYAEAAADAEKAVGKLKPATRKEVSTPSFYSINEHNWIWGVDMKSAITADYTAATSDAWIRSFSGDAYATGAGCYTMINTLLYDKIPASDVRKGWWVDENLNSPNLKGLAWGEFKEQAIAPASIENTKEPFLPYTNIKFGVEAGIGSTSNESDWPLMRVEEMILIQAEGYLKSGNEAKAKEILGNFVKTYRDSLYNVDDYSNLADEIWKQRRIELWGEGFFTFDANRLQKPIVRFHGKNVDGKVVKSDNNMPDAFAFNLSVDDGWRLLRFPQSEMNTNYSVVDNTDGSKPQVNQEPELRDGVTD